MAVVGDDPGETGGIEDVLLQVVFPEPPLLRLEAALQTAGEAADDRFQRCQFTINRAAKQRELRGIDHRISACRFVEFAGEDPILIGI